MDKDVRDLFLKFVVTPIFIAVGAIAVIALLRTL